jgi:hypothetical protein
MTSAASPTPVAPSKDSYQPGVCNIGPAEIRQRRRVGWIGAAAAVVFLVLAFALNIPAPYRLLVLLPVGMAASGFLQAGMHFCARFGASGLFNFGAVGPTESVMEADFRKADQRKAIQIIVVSFVIAIVVAVVAWLIP